MKPYIKPISEFLEFPTLMEGRPMDGPVVGSSTEANAAPMRTNGKVGGMRYI